MFSMNIIVLAVTAIKLTKYHRIYSDASYGGTPLNKLYIPSCGQSQLKSMGKYPVAKSIKEKMQEALIIKGQQPTC